MVVTRASAKTRVMSESDLESCKTVVSPVKSPPPTPSPNEISLSSSSSPRSLATPRTPVLLPITPLFCTTCREEIDMNISTSNAPNFSFSLESLSTQLCEIKTALDRINSKITELEGSVSDHSCMINELERSVAIFTNTVKTNINLISNHEPAGSEMRACASNDLESRASNDLESRASKSNDLKSHAPLYSDVVKAVHEQISPSPKPLVSRGPHPELDSRGASGVAVTHNMHKPNTVLIVGDSNTQHTHLEGTGVSKVRIPTYVVEDIDPQMCVGFETVWLHVGVNSLKPRNCRNLTAVRQKYNVFASKINEITKLSPQTKVVVSPILPTALRELNFRIVYFNRLLLSNRERWHILKFGDFLDVNDGLLDQYFMTFRNRYDKIHLGYRGISLLTSLVKSGIARAKDRTSSRTPVHLTSKLRDY